MVFVPEEIPKSALQKELKLLKDKKSDPSSKKDSKGGKNDDEDDSQVEDSKHNKAEEEAKRRIELFRSAIKESINLKIIKQNLTRLKPMDHYTYLAQSDTLKSK